MEMGGRAVLDPGTSLTPTHTPLQSIYLAQTWSIGLEGIELGQDGVGQLSCVLWAPGRKGFKHVGGWRARGRRGGRGQGGGGGVPTCGIGWMDTPAAWRTGWRSAGPTPLTAVSAPLPGKGNRGCMCCGGHPGKRPAGRQGCRVESAHTSFFQGFLIFGASWAIPGFSKLRVP